MFLLGDVLRPRPDDVDYIIGRIDGVASLVFMDGAELVYRAEVLKHLRILKAERVLELG